MKNPRTIVKNKRKFTEISLNPHCPEYATPETVQGGNYLRWNDALAELGLTVLLPEPARDLLGEELPDIDTTLFDEELLKAGQYALLSTVSRDHPQGLAGIKGPWSPKDVLTDMARVTIGQEQRHPDILPDRLHPMLKSAEISALLAF